jgi:hypothetical protein
MLLLLQRFPGEGVGGHGATVRPLVVCIDLSPETGMAFSFSPSPMSRHSGLKLSFFETIFVWGQDHVDCSIDILPQIVFQNKDDVLGGLLSRKWALGVCCRLSRL